MPDGHRFTMLDECRPLNPFHGTHRTVSLGGAEPFTMLPSAQPISLLSSMVVEFAASPGRESIQRIATDLAQLLVCLPKSEAVILLAEFSKAVNDTLMQINEMAEEAFDSYRNARRERRPIV